MILGKNTVIQRKSVNIDFRFKSTVITALQTSDALQSPFLGSILDHGIDRISQELSIVSHMEFVFPDIRTEAPLN